LPMSARAITGLSCTRVMVAAAISEARPLPQVLGLNR
jgi:hypothetical protein